MATPPAPPEDHLVLTDPRALRALAHPARTAVVDELYQGAVRTSSELATLTGLTPSAMSYHLRALEKWGVVRRAGASGDGRERPWRAAASSFSWSGESASDTVSDTLAGLYLDRLRRDLDRWNRREPHEPREWRDRSSIHRGFPWLTASETAELTGRVSELVDEIKAGRTPEDHPDDARRVAFFVAVVPVDEA